MSWQLRADQEANSDVSKQLVVVNIVVPTKVALQQDFHSPVNRRSIGKKPCKNPTSAYLHAIPRVRQEVVMAMVIAAAHTAAQSSIQITASFQEWHTPRIPPSRTNCRHRCQSPPGRQNSRNEPISFPWSRHRHKCLRSWPVSLLHFLSTWLL